LKRADTAQGHAAASAAQQREIERLQRALLAAENAKTPAKKVASKADKLAAAAALTKAVKDALPKMLSEAQVKAAAQRGAAEALGATGVVNTLASFVSKQTSRQTSTAGTDATALYAREDIHRLAAAAAAVDNSNKSHELLLLTLGQRAGGQPASKRIREPSASVSPPRSHKSARRARERERSRDRYRHSDR
jgi:hypothetical protein